jgi:NAD(P)-dependent dehydrogenase (short-subunit alcohol dehydrogenase family)
MPAHGKDRVWFITGSSTGFGRLLAQEVLKRGDRVVATARRLEAVKDIEDTHKDKALALALDVTKPDQIQVGVEAALTRFGRIDILVNNAGYGVSGAAEEVSEEEFMPMFETNILGLIRMTKAVLPHLRKQRSGHILNLSSIGGLIATPGITYYNTSKFAVEGFTAALAGEMEPLGVSVTAIEPGPFRTEFLGRSKTVAAIQIDDYRDTAGKSRTYFETQQGNQEGDPQKAVEAMIAIVDAPLPPRNLVLGRAAYTRMRARIEAWDKNLTDWEATSIGADFPQEKTS